MTWEILALYMGALVSVFTLSVEGKHNTLKGKGCPQGCLTCSPFNGCITCKPQYFLLLYRSGMKHIGICTHACPTGYYPKRGTEINRCLKCRVDNCDQCFTRNFCARCSSGFFSHRGKCYESCPEGMYEEKRTGDCKPMIDCEVAEWNEWGPCIRDGQSCGRKWGEQIRTRDVITFPSRQGEPCPVLLEIQKCRVNPRFCPEPTDPPDKSMDGRRKKKNKRQRRRRKRRRKGKTSKVTDGADEVRPSSRRNNKKSRERTTSTLLS